MNPSPEAALFALALAEPAEKRAAFLDLMCEGDAALRSRLDALLAAHEQPDTLLATQTEAPRPTIKLDLTDAPDEAVGQTLGRYKLPERVGKGGCGAVYVAEQTEPVRRRVVLKVIKLGMDPSRSSRGSRPNGRRWPWWLRRRTRSGYPSRFEMSGKTNVCPRTLCIQSLKNDQPLTCYDHLSHAHYRVGIVPLFDRHQQRRR